MSHRPRQLTTRRPASHRYAQLPITAQFLMDWFHQVFVEASFARLVPIFGLAITGNCHDDFLRKPFFTERFNHVVSVHPGQASTCGETKAR